MEVNPTVVATQIQHQQWLEDIRACNERPASMTVDEWCQLHGIKKNTYYWRMKRLRKECLKEMQDLPAEQQPVPLNCAPSFVELSQTFDAPAEGEKVTLKLGTASIEIPETISDGFLHRILKAARHA